MANLIFIGDSLTQWCDWERRFPHHRVMNLGISGETVEGLLDRTERIHAAVSAPDYLFLMTGINNIANEQYEFIVPYREIVRRLATWYKKAAIVVQSILPADLAWIDIAMIATTNRQLASLAEEFGAEYLDLYRQFLAPGGRPKSGLLADDGVHLAAAGYDVWSEEVSSFLARRG